MSESQSAHSSQSESVQATGSNAKSSTGSGENYQVASSDEATSSESIPAPRNDDPTPVAGEPNRSCVDGQWKIYRDAKMVNDKQKMARLIQEECRVLIGSLHTVPDIHWLFKEFNASYAATLRGSISKRSKPIAQAPLISTLVRGCPVDISPATISRFLYGPTTGHSWSTNTSEFDYRWDIVRSGVFQSNAEQ
uniref:Integrase core domain containing protein n=1 Tax=Solanum tuberosum TaxID=4113 RepID=M1DZM6_SOLTU